MVEKREQACAHAHRLPGDTRTGAGPRQCPFGAPPGPVPSTIGATARMWSAMSPTARARRWPALAVIPAASGQRPADHLTHRPRNASRPPLRRHRRGAPAWAALSLLAGLLGLLALLSPVAAQSVTLVSNATKGSDASSNITGDRAQAFTTGAAGATLSSVEIISEDPEGDDVAVSLCMVDGSNHPTSDCTALTAPSSFAAGTLVFTAPANTTLAANTTYSLLVASPGGQSSEHWTLPSPTTRTPAAPRAGVSPMPLTPRRPRMYGTPTVSSAGRCASPSRARSPLRPRRWRPRSRTRRRCRARRSATRFRPPRSLMRTATR